MATKAKKTTVATSLVLRCCREDMSSKNGFVWPDVGGTATAPDWKDNTECGNGLHGWLYGQGDHSTSDYWNDTKAQWLVVRVADSDLRMLGGKCKFQSGVVVFKGSKPEAADYIIANEPKAANVAVIGTVLECGENGSLLGGALSVLTGGYSATMTGGDYAKMTGGYYATMTGGNFAVMTGGDSAVMTGGDSAVMTGGNFAKMTGGDSATMTGGYSATMTGGDYAKMTGGYYATMTGGNSAVMMGGNSAVMMGGDYAKMTGGNFAKMTGGNSAVMTGGYFAVMTGGDSAVMNFQYWDGKRIRTVVAYVGEDGIKPNVAYKLDANHKPVKVTQ